MNTKFDVKVDSDFISKTINMYFSDNMYHRKEVLKTLVTRCMSGTFNMVRDIPIFHDYFHACRSEERKRLKDHFDVRKEFIYQMRSEYKIVLNLILTWLNVVDVNESARAVFRAINELFNGNMEYMDDITISSLVTLCIQFYQRLGLLVYPNPNKNDKRSSIDDFLDFFEDGIHIWEFPEQHYVDKFWNSHCAALSANDLNIFDLGISYDHINKVKSVSESFNTKLAPNVEMMEHRDYLNLDNLTSVHFGHLKQIESHSILSNPTFDVNNTALAKLMVRYESVPEIKFNQIKFYDKELDDIYTRVIMEQYGTPYLLVFDKDDINSICGVLVENSNDSNNYIKIQFNNRSVYKYEYDKEILEYMKNEIM